MPLGKAVYTIFLVLSETDVKQGGPPGGKRHSASHTALRCKPAAPVMCVNVCCPSDGMTHHSLSARWHWLP